VEHMRNSYWFSGLFGRQGFTSWEAKGKQTLYDRAHERVKRATAGYREMEPVAGAKKCAALDQILSEGLAEMKARDQGRPSIFRRRRDRRGGSDRHASGKFRCGF
jgi:trimethylamine:corrinoid methyltransferase-like protein